ncbi:DUF4919 domain-containing protein [Microbacter margulisiae]|uniref:DUF4919 domain-containing protein n=1 Tax=Microbacter margulisiae TaxID=1350067 RepID=A0A7W5DP36_9PORP|nr:DUF4919 domain-containing protein [Microbacter margulisiae]MBB3186475.1 hypothetical protein [Microbacter margulisiae]
MKKILLAILFIASISGINAQVLPLVAPNYSLIKSTTQNPASPYYYPTLFKRYVNNDTTLTISDYKMLYYGFTYQKAYKPYGNPPQDAILARYADKDILTPADCDTIILYAGQLVAQFPFDLHWINRIAYAYHVLGKDSTANLWSYKSKKIIQTIMSTGNGRTIPSAWHVIEEGDEYEIIYMLGLFPVNQSLVALQYDYIRVASNPSGIKGFYFNVRRLLDMEGSQK